MVELEEIIKNLAETYEFEESEVKYLYSKLEEFPIFSNSVDCLKASCLEVLLQTLVSTEEMCNARNRDECIEYSINYIFGEQDSFKKLYINLFD